MSDKVERCSSSEFARGNTPTDRRARRLDSFLFRVMAGCAGLFIRHGNINLQFRDSGWLTLGDGTGQPVDIHFNRLPALLRILVNPGLAVGETYVNGDWEIEEADLPRFLGYLLINEARIEGWPLVRALNGIYGMASHVLRTNTTRQSRKNASHHYDIGNDLYESFLDGEMVYSCAFFTHDTQSLEAAQKNKLEITLDRLQVEPGMRVLDIGCGWGAMTRAIARRNAEAVGITLADRQLTWAERHLPFDLQDRVSCQLQDYRDHAEENPEAYDRVVSIGMFEHVGRQHFVDYFKAINRMLKPGGRALVHSIIKPNRTRTNAWMRKYIFPGGLIPQLEDMTVGAEAAKLVRSQEPFIHDGSHYAMTLRHWRKRFNGNFSALDHDRYDERFRRLWNFYLASSEAAFDTLGYGVAQMVVEKPA
ncbi:class I SAM-dependent methyltransferase [Fodinicurvata halophila]|uniref:Class I SAM-dependent methyltransferase n=1 Tax=Fodinicurvata halophila TaxID=1419723 RepID=A0ABV8UPP2_9PROT